MADPIPVADLLAQVDIAPFDPEEVDGAPIVSAFVIFQYQRPDWQFARTTFVSSERMSDEQSIGLLTMVLDQARARAQARWVDED